MSQFTSGAIIATMMEISRSAQEEERDGPLEISLSLALSTSNLSVIRSFRDGAVEFPVGSWLSLSPALKSSLEEGGVSSRHPNEN